jgi:hypothetical protein
MDGQSTCRFYLIFLATVGAVRAQGGFFDFSNGMIDAMKGPCEQATGVWRSDDAINYSVEGGLEGPKDGKVIVSDSSTNASSCLSIPGGLQQIQKNFTIKLYVFLPEANRRRKLAVNFVTDKASFTAFTVEPFVAGWNEITMSIPDPNTVKPPYPGPYKVKFGIYFFSQKWNLHCRTYKFVFKESVYWFLPFEERQLFTSFNIYVRFLYESNFWTNFTQKCKSLLFLNCIVKLQKWEHSQAVFFFSTDFASVFSLVHEFY